MNETGSKEISLNWDVFVAKRQGVTRDLPPGKEQLQGLPVLRLSFMVLAMPSSSTPC